MERRAKKGKKEAFINFWVRSSLAKPGIREGDVDLFKSSSIFIISLPKLLNTSIIRKPLSTLFGFKSPLLST